MRFLILALSLVLWLYACTQPPEVPEDELFDCELSKDGKLLICYDRKHTKVARD